MATATLTKFGQIARTRDLGDLVESRGIKLFPGSGRVRQGVCPFHDEGEGSFTVYADSQRFHCFGCDTWGDALDFIRKLDGVSVQEAARTLQQAARDSRKVSLLPAPKPRRTPRQDRAVVRAALAYYRDNLLGAASGQPGRNYLKNRGIGRATAEALHLGYCTGNGLKAHLHKQGFGKDRILRSGLLLDRGKRERFAGMVVVPEISERQSGLDDGSHRPQEREATLQRAPRQQGSPGHRHPASKDSATHSRGGRIRLAHAARVGTAVRGARRQRQRGPSDSAAQQGAGGRGDSRAGRQREG